MALKPSQLQTRFDFELLNYETKYVLHRHCSTIMMTTLSQDIGCEPRLVQKWSCHQLYPQQPHPHGHHHHQDASTSKLRSTKSPTSLPPPLPDHMFTNDLDDWFLSPYLFLEFTTSQIWAIVKSCGEVCFHFKKQSKLDFINLDITINLRVTMFVRWHFS